MQAIRATRPGGHVGFVGVAHGVELPGEELFFTHVHLHGGPAPVRRFLPELIDLIWNRQIDPGKVFDLDLPLEQAAEGYQAMDERRGDQGAPAPVTDRAVGGLSSGTLIRCPSARPTRRPCTDCATASMPPTC